MKAGDLVRRGKLWTDWIKQNAWMKDSMISKIGMIIKIDNPDITKFQTFVVVLWGNGIHSLEDPEDLEVLDEKG